MNDESPRPLQVTLIDWRPLRRNSLLGFASVQAGALIIRDITLHTTYGKYWAGLPAKPRLASGGDVMKDERGKILYTPIMEWANKQTADRFSDAVIAAVREDHAADLAA